MSKIITKEMVKEAKSTPNGWVYKIDRNYDLSENIPPKAIVGAWKVDVNGEISGSFIKNKNYLSLKKQPYLLRD